MLQEHHLRKKKRAVPITHVSRIHSPHVIIPVCSPLSPVKGEQKTADTEEKEK